MSYPIKPAVVEALNVSKACTETGTAKRVVLTSSIAAVSAGLGVFIPKKIGLRKGTLSPTKRVSSERGVLPGIS